MIKRYKDELKELKTKMIKAEKFAKKLPLFEEKIIENKYTGEENHIYFGSKYKDMYLAWGMNRNHYQSDSRVKITNYDEKYDNYLFGIYINTISLYDEYAKFRLEDICNKVKIFFYDEFNSTFYIEDEHIEEFLEELNKWYLNAKNSVEEYRKQEKIKKLKEELAELEKVGDKIK